MKQGHNLITTASGQYIDRDYDVIGLGKEGHQAHFRSMRIDIWDVAASKEPEPIDAGLPRGFDDLFEFGKTLGKGGFGLVRVCVEKSTGKEYACKSICKRLDIPNLSAAKQAAHIDNTKREVEILQRLRGTLSVVEVRGAWEDDRDIHIVMELCRGGELEHDLGKRPYSEKLVAGYMRSVLLTIAQCHAHRILHRDIKPGNFMLLNEDVDSPLKAIDFGLATFFEPDKLPRTDLGLEGTPWFMAPEVLSSKVYPVSDVWSAGVMAYQLLSGMMPFDDRRNPSSPSLSAIWKGILTEEPNFKRSAWGDVSEEGKDFVKQLLIKDHAKRPAAAQMLEHPWLQSSFYSRNARPLSATVVQRLQRFSQTPILRRSILELIAAELLELAPPQLDPSGHGMNILGSTTLRGNSSALTSQLSDEMSTTTGSSPSDAGLLSPLASMRAEGLSLTRYRGASVHGGRAFARTPSSQALSLLSHAYERNSRRRGGGASSSDGDGSVHGEEDYWRLMRAASELALMGSQHGRGAALSYLHTHPRSEEERDEQRKAARLALDTSKHVGGEYDRLLHHLESQQARLRTSRSMSSLAALQDKAEQQLEKTTAPPPPPAWPGPAASGAAAEVSAAESEESGGGRRRGGSAALAAIQAQPSSSSAHHEKSTAPVRRVTFEPLPTPQKKERTASAFIKETNPASPSSPSGHRPNASWPSPPEEANPTTVTTPAELSRLMRKMRFKPGEALSSEELSGALEKLGYDIAPSEVEMLLGELAPAGEGAEIHPTQFVASQLDWDEMQHDSTDLWLECARRAFQGLDADKDGRINTDTLINVLRKKLPAAEVDYAVERALVEAGYADAEEMDFEGFLRLLQPGSKDAPEAALHLYDARMPLDLIPNLDPTVHKSNANAKAALGTISEQS